MSKRLLVLAALPFLGGFGAHHFQRATDPGRWAQERELRTVFVPSPEATKVASMGFNMVIADLLWIRAVLLFVDFLEADSDDGVYWTRTVLKTVGTLDPAWRTPFFYGGGMLRLLGNIEGSDEIFSDGMKAFPQDAYFPFSLAMNAYLHHKDLEMAVEYLQKAAGMPGAPRWYRSAAAEFISRQGRRATAMLYLKEQIQNANSERERVLLDNKYKSLQHEEESEILQDRQQKWETFHGRTLESVKSLAPLPPDPLGGEWIVAVDGKVRSSVDDLAVARRTRNEERAILVNP
jgi:hypothetical protein